MINLSIKRQNGAATLVIAVVLLISMTLVSLFAARVIKTEIQIEANHYRTMQAFAQASCGIDVGTRLYDTGRVSELIDGVNDGCINDNGGFAQVKFISVGVEADRCDATSSPQNGLIRSKGFSDDLIATRTITVCVGPVNILNNDGPEIPLITRTQIDTTGNAQVINRYTNTNIWSAENVKITGASMATYIRDPAAGPLTREQLLNPTAANTQLVSNRNLGNGADIISNDPSLSLGAGFFGNFFGTEDRQVLKQLAEGAGQSFDSINDAKGKSGLIYLNGDQQITGDTIGSIDAPAIIIVDGDFTIAGNTVIHGLVYVVGTMNVSGTPSIVGSNIVENANSAPSAFSGSGTLNLVFWQNFMDDDDAEPLTGLTSVIEGSWRDW